MRHFFFYALLFCSIHLLAQEKRKIDHTLYDSWNSLSAVQQSKSGQLITYEINPSVGDGVLTLRSRNDQFLLNINRGKNGKIHAGEKFFVCMISPAYDTIRQLKLDKVKEDKHPKDSLLVYWPSTDSSLYLPEVKSYQLSEDGDWIAYLKTDDLQPKCSCTKKKKKKKSCGHEKIKTSGKTLELLNPITGNTRTVHRVSSYELNRQGTHLLYTVSEKGDKDTLDVYLMNLSTGKGQKIANRQLSVNQLTFDYNGEQIAFLGTPDTNKKKNFDLHYLRSTDSISSVVVDSTTSGMPADWTVSEFSRLHFSRDGSMLYFGTAEIVRQDPEDTLLDSEKAKVDVWAGFDLLIQPNQLNNRSRDLKKNYLAIYHVKDKKFVQVADESVEDIQTAQRESNRYALGENSKPYHKERTWSTPWRSDIYLVDLFTGDKKLIHEGAYEMGSLSPSGKLYNWYNPKDSCWYSKDIETSVVVNLSDKIDANFSADNNGQPSLGWSEGSSGWTILEGKEYYLVNSEWDIYALHPNMMWVSVTYDGKKTKNRYRLWRTIDNDSIYVQLHENFIVGRNDTTKDESVYRLAVDTSSSLYVSMEAPLFDKDLVLSTQHKILSIDKAEKSDLVLFQRQSFQEYGELELTDTSFNELKEITETNPLQKELNWATVEFVEWKSYSGIPLRGLLYKPEDFDSTKSYPLMVYFYEMYQNSFHTHYSPKATASIIYPLEYASNGYIIFIPDVRYTPGHPAKSAYDCIVSGTDYLTSKYNWIDTNRMALQGQSWGGYQTAMLVTMTKKYRAAMAGAPVSNMFSAYGGIRWGSGLSRMFQYECTQSRIGHTIWDRPDLYVENSPLFHLPNVETPLLIMHNDQDGAVPWYQGIELYMGMRRLDKDVWLLNYNGDDHNLRQLANKKDLSIRMRQFFDHYLLGTPQPKWMEKGVPAVDKGVDYGLDIEK